MPWEGTILISDFKVTGTAVNFARPSLPKTSTIPIVDISQEVSRQVVIAQGTAEIYQGHPTTVLMSDNHTMFCVWTYGHGGSCGPLKKSVNGGLTWSQLLPVHPSWTTVSNCPGIFRMSGANGIEKLRVFAQKNYGNGIVSMVQSFSNDQGATWSEMTSLGIGGKLGMPFCSIVNLSPGVYLGMTNIRRPFDPDSKSNTVAQSYSYDGGATWSKWEKAIDMLGYYPCEPFVMKSPDGKQLLCLLRENTRAYNAFAMISNDDGKTWSEPWEVPAPLSGDRHIARYAQDGRIVCVFRDKSMDSSRHHFVGWVGTYDDIINKRQGQYKIKLLHNYRVWDCGYPGLEILPDGTFVATTYLKYREGEEQNSVACTRFKLSETDSKVQ
ncbi:MAG TPA: exo-alpha-sialidase [Phycisphaerales bacterium]|nr:exo-alpha-sialidase [Phycisphaerales bacterium]